MSLFSSMEMSGYSSDFQPSNSSTPKRSQRHTVARIYNLLVPSDPCMTFTELSLGDERDHIHSSPLRTPVRKAVASTVVAIMDFSPPMAAGLPDNSASSGYKSASSECTYSCVASPVRPRALGPRPETMGGEATTPCPRVALPRPQTMGGEERASLPATTTHHIPSPSKRRLLAKKIQRFGRKLRGLSTGSHHIQTLAIL